MNEQILEAVKNQLRILCVNDKPRLEEIGKLSVADVSILAEGEDGTVVDAGKFGVRLVKVRVESPKPEETESAQEPEAESVESEPQASEDIPKPEADQKPRKNKRGAK